ncbi:hypothetical protein P153DRAFT_391374 [Dothidotthia symphoricarpi CBS 119687]|uniref:Uncharacterized protein n=1 Tax=Dothidotthia symphoricarpi CBS 119687 TaxID=1392245 RepID=A0A6A5ZXZ9_9PLEO|nr:uncharacterized protein P153DRAFT_391374 [Dothidotthia symphoricarpi CBS 119687]KAF2123647.1 hypothetical protein P153DRAFT_391374 [Dothidotthia symphoricarpi CBS 119687]
MSFTESPFCDSPAILSNSRELKWVLGDSRARFIAARSTMTSRAKMQASSRASMPTLNFNSDLNMPLHDLTESDYEEGCAILARLQLANATPALSRFDDVMNENEIELLILLCGKKILQERRHNEGTQYLVEFTDIDPATGEPYTPRWVWWVTNDVFREWTASHIAHISDELRPARLPTAKRKRVTFLLDDTASKRQKLELDDTPATHKPAEICSDFIQQLEDTAIGKLQHSVQLSAHVISATSRQLGTFPQLKPKHLDTLFPAPNNLGEKLRAAVELPSHLVRMVPKLPAILEVEGTSPDGGEGMSSVQNAGDEILWDSGTESYYEV